MTVLNKHVQSVLNLKILLQVLTQKRLGSQTETHRHVRIHAEQSMAILSSCKRYGYVCFTSVLHQLGIHALLQSFQSAIHL